MKGALGFILFFALLLIAAPIGLSAGGNPLGGMTSAIMLGFGSVLFLISGTLLIITQLYVKAPANMAFVRSGMGGMKVIMDGGALVIPVVHEIIRVSLETLRLQVKREGPEALITSDKLRVDIHGEFFVRVPPEEESIKSAARSLGDKMGDVKAVETLVVDKLISALRTVAATRTLEQLNSDRKAFMEEVIAIVRPDLAHNGLNLEVPTISKLDQTDPKYLNPNNVFDAQGLRTSAEITQKQLTEKNMLERAGEQARVEQDVRTRQRVLGLEQERAQAEAEQASNVAQIRAKQDREAKEKEIEAQRAVSLADVERTKAIEVAQRLQQQAVAVAERDKETAVTEADQKVEVAKRARESAIANAERDRAQAEAKRAEAEAERETALQAVKTVEVEAGAERDKKQRVIGAQAAAETQYVTAQRAADAQAYQVERQAEARKTAAEAEAVAVRTAAQAAAEAKKQQADGDQAVAMVPVNVAQRQVEVDQSRVNDVLTPELRAKQDFGQAAIDLQIRLAIIEAEKEARIAAAHAMGESLGKANMTFWGSPDQVDQITKRFVDGQSIAHAMNGFTGTLGADGKTMLANIGAVVRAVAEKLGGGADEAAIEAAVRGALASRGGESAVRSAAK